MAPRHFAGLMFGGTVALAASGVVELGTFKASGVDNAAAPIAERGPTSPDPAVVTTAAAVSEPVVVGSIPPEPVVASPSSPAADATAVPPVSTAPLPTPTPDTGMQLASLPPSDPAESGTNSPVGAAATSSAVEASAIEPVSTAPGSPSPPDTGMQLASLPPSDPAESGTSLPVRSIEARRPCVTDTCIDEYLWSVYERTPKIDTIKVTERIKETVKKKGKTRTVTRTIVTYAVDDFTWKDPAAAQRAGMSLMDYVIGGMDRGFRLKLYRALRAMDDAGLMPGITSAFRDNYRQSLAVGLKAAADSSFHGGSRRGGYRHGLAADLVSVKGETRVEREAASEVLWKWIDAHEKELGIGRPYLEHDPPHVGPLDGAEYMVKRRLANARKRTLQTKTAEKPGSQATRQLAADSGAIKHANPAKVSKLSSLQKRLALPR